MFGRLLTRHRGERPYYSPFNDTARTGAVSLGWVEHLFDILRLLHFLLHLRGLTAVDVLVEHQEPDEAEHHHAGGDDQQIRVDR